MSLSWISAGRLFGGIIMRTFAPFVVAAFAIVGSASANNVNLALSAASVSSCSTLPNTDACSLQGYGASNAVDGSSGTTWVASTPAGVSAQSPYLLIDVGYISTAVSSIQVQGLGNSGLFSAFDVFVGNSLPTTTNLLNLTNLAAWGTLVLNQPYQPDGTAWTDTSTASILGTPIEYVVLYALNGNDGGYNTGCPGTCYAGNADFTAISGQDDLAATEVVINDPVTPEPASIGLVSFTLLAFGFIRRRRG